MSDSPVPNRHNNSTMRWRKALLARNDGNAAIEYSLILAAIAAVVILGLSFLTPHLFDFGGSGDFSEVAHARAKASKANPKPKATQAEVMEEPTRAVPWFQIGLVAAALLAAVAYYFERQRAKRKREREAEEAEEARFRKEIEADPIEQPQFIAKRQQILRFITRRHNESNSRMRVGDLMTPKLTVVQPKTKLDEIRRLVNDNKVRHLLVTETNGTLRGVISDRDLSTRSGKRAEDIMTPNPFSVPESMVVSEAIRVMVCHGVSCLPVTNKDFPMGMLTTTDLLLAFQCAQQLLKQVAAAAPHPERSCSEGLAEISAGELQANLQT